jgi:hypothetical protein
MGNGDDVRDHEHRRLISWQRMAETLVLRLRLLSSYFEKAPKRTLLHCKLPARHAR